MKLKHLTKKSPMKRLRLKQRLHHLRDARRRTLSFLFLVGVLEYYDFFAFAFTFFYFLHIFDHEKAEIYGIAVLVLITYMVRPLGYRLQIWFIQHKAITMRKVIILNSLIMTASIVSTGLLPVNDNRRWIIFICLGIGRILHGITFGVQMQSSLHYIKTIFPKSVQGSVASSIIGAQLGLTAAIFVNKLLAAHYNVEEMVFAWRLPFFIGGIISISLLFFRLHLFKAGYDPHSSNCKVDKPLDHVAIKCGSKVWLSLLLASTRGSLIFSLFVVFPGILSWMLGWENTKVADIMLAATLVNTSATWLCRNFHLSLRRRKLLIPILFLLIPATALLWYSLLANDRELAVTGILLLAGINGYLYIIISKFIGSLFNNGEHKVEAILFIENFQFFGFNFVRRMSILLLIVGMGGMISANYSIFLVCFSIWLSAITGIISVWILKKSKDYRWLS